MALVLQVVEALFVGNGDVLKALDRVQRDFKVVRNLVKAPFVVALHAGQDLDGLCEGIKTFKALFVQALRSGPWSRRSV